MFCNPPSASASLDPLPRFAASAALSTTRDRTSQCPKGNGRASSEPLSDEQVKVEPVRPERLPFDEFASVDRYTGSPAVDEKE